MEMENGNAVENAVPASQDISQDMGGSGNSPEKKPKWVVGRTVLGILSIVLFVMVMFQSCAAGLSNALSDNGEVGGSAGFLCALNLLVAGLIVLVARKTVKKAPMIVAAVLMYLNLFYAQIMAGSYKDLVIWGFLSFAFGVVYLFSALHTKKQFIIAGIISAVFLFLMIAAGGTGSTKPQSENIGAAAEETADQQTADTENTEDSAKEDKKEEPADTEDAEETKETKETEKPASSEAPAAENEEKSAERDSVEGAAWETGNGQAVLGEDSIGSLWVQVAVPVKNTGSVNLYMSAGTIDLEDADGHLVESMSLVPAYPQVLKPGETGWYFEETTLDQKPSSDLKAVPHVDVREASVDCIRYETSDITLADDEFGDIKVTGRVENTTEEEGSMVEVALLLYDDQENLIGAMNTYLDGNLAAGDKIGFSASSFANVQNLAADDIADYKIYAYPTQFQF